MKKPRNPFETYLDRLMARSLIPWCAKVEPEQRLSIELADALRKLTIKGEYRGMWWHTANEGKRHAIVALILKAMGMLPGAPDFVFLWSFGSGIIELKVGKPKLQPSQEDFKQWAADSAIPHATCTSVEQALAYLRTWGAFTNTRSTESWKPARETYPVIDPCVVGI